MISTKQRTIALSFIALATVFVLFAAGPLVTHEAQAYWGGGWGWHHGWGWQHGWGWHHPWWGWHHGWGHGGWGHGAWGHGGW